MNRKASLLASILILSIGALATPSQAAVVWVHSWPSAVKQAQKSNKIIMVDLYTSWCVWCKELDKHVYPTKAVSLASTHFINVKLDAEHEASALAARYSVTGFPTVLFIDSNGVLVDKWVGYRPAAQFASELPDVSRSVADFPLVESRALNDPSNVAAAAQYAALLLRRDRVEDAVAALSNLDDNASGSALAADYAQLASIYSDQDKPMVAAEWYRKVIRASKSVDEIVEARGALADLAMADDNTKAAIAQYRAVQALPGVTKKQINWAAQNIKLVSAEKK